MSCSYQKLLHSVALRANALVGAQAATLESTYSTATLTSANFKSADFPFSSFADAIIQAQQDFVMEVATTGNSPFRTPLLSDATGIVSSTKLPGTADNGKPIVGDYGSAYDDSDGTSMIEMPLDVITRFNRNANSHYVCPVYYYKFDGGYIYHTRPTVGLEVCTYDRADVVTAFAANGNMLLSDVFETGIVARALSFLFRDGAYAEQAAVWRQYSNDALVAVRSVQSIPEKSVPVPITNIRAN